MRNRLTPTELRAIERMLDERWGELQQEVHDAIRATAGMEGVDLVGRVGAPDRDATLLDALADLNLATIERHVHELRAIKVAKQRLREHTYGMCGRCNEPIAVGRLLANPSAETCIGCQQRLEHVGRPRRPEASQTRG
jgi:RNA polymerase-binding transcription factor DksA